MMSAISQANLKNQKGFMVIEALAALAILGIFLVLWSSNLILSVQFIRRSLDDEKKMRAFESLISSIERGEQLELFWWGGELKDFSGCQIESVSESSGVLFDEEALSIQKLTLKCHKNERENIYGETNLSLALVPL